MRDNTLCRLTNEIVTGSGTSSDYTKTFAYDPVGNRLTQVTTGATAADVAYAYDSRDRAQSASGVIYSWDDNGNLVGKLGGDSYSWDYEDRLVRVTKANGTRIDHVYDVDGNRVRTSVTPAGGSSIVTNYLVDTAGRLSHVVAESDHDGAVIAYYVRAGDDLLAVRRTGGFATYLTDGLGSVRGLAAR